MAIFVKTGNPINSITLPQKPTQLTYRDLVNQITDELDDTNETYLPQIQRAISSAIRFCAREPFYFNQNHELILTTKAGCGLYPSYREMTLTNFGNVSAVYCEDSTDFYSLIQKKPAELEILQKNTKGQDQPVFYSFMDNALCLYPIPDKAYMIKLLLNPAVFPAIDSPDSSSPWFEHAFDLIKARAKYEIYKDILKDAGLAAAAFNDFNEARTSLQKETSRRSGVERLCVTQF